MGNHRTLTIGYALRTLHSCSLPLPHCSHQWSLVEFLPRALQQHMVLLLAEWMYLPWQAANRAAAAASGAMQGGSQAVLDARQAEQVQVRPRPTACSQLAAVVQLQAKVCYA
jgi:hypothetical protein